jgi:hypothetical protein
MRSTALAALVLTLVAAAQALGASAPPTLPGARGCPIFPATNPWNERVDRLPVAAGSQAMIAAIGAEAGLHPDFGSYAGYGIPYTVVSKTTHRVNVSFDYADESDKGPYPIPAHPRIEAGGDRHVLLLDRDACKLYELYDAQEQGGSWHAGSGAIWNLRSNHLRPDGWTSADAAGLPILPGLVRYDEVARGAIDHALRFTAPETSDTHLWPARHDAGKADAGLPPMGLRVRLKASFDISHYPKQARVVLQALKTYGMILADNGSPWYVSGASDRRFDDDALHALGQVKGSDLEVVDATPAALRAAR